MLTLEEPIVALDDILKRFQAITPGVEGCGIISRDGFTIAAELPMTIEEQQVAAVASAILALGEQAADELEQGAVERILVQSARGNVIVVNAGPDALFCAVVNPSAKLGWVFMQMQHAAARIRAALP